jgi:hypothetical protein
MVLWVLFMFQNVSAAEGTKSKVHWCAILFLWPEKNYLAPVVLFNFPLSIYLYIYIYLLSGSFALGKNYFALPFSLFFAG